MLRKTPVYVRVLEAVVQRLKRANDCREHCHCVTELRTQIGAFRWVAGLALTAAFGSLLARGCDLTSLRLPPVLPPSPSGSVLPGIDGAK